MRTVDTEAYLDAMKELTDAGHQVSVRVAGSSMVPFLAHQRDRVFFAAPDRPLRRGDPVFYQRTGGQYVMHRICRIRPEGYFMLGDAQTLVEGPISREQIFALVTRAERKGKLLTETSLLWRFFAGPWLFLRPLRPAILTVYSRLRRIIPRKAS